MHPQPAKAQAVSEICELLRLAAARRLPVAAIQDGRLRLLCPHMLGRNQTEGVGGAASPWRNSAKSSCARIHGTTSLARRGKPASIQSTATPTLSLETVRKKGSEATAAARGPPARCAASRSSADYAARGGPGDPRGRKSGAGPEATNPR